MGSWETGEGAGVAAPTRAEVFSCFNIYCPSPQSKSWPESEDMVGLDHP